MRILYLIHEPWPTFRSDVATLFGRSLARLGLSSDIVTESGASQASWPAGRARLHPAPRSRAVWYLSKLWHNLRVLASAQSSEYDAIQVRDMPVTAMLGLLAARLRGIAFFYWMSFPKSEAQTLRARSRGPSAGLRYIVPLLQGHLGTWLLYRVVLPRADHVFVQSQTMLDKLAARGLSPAMMTPVPMGVDAAAADPARIAPASDSRLAGRRVLVYLGTIDPERGIEMLLETLALARAREPSLLLVIVGDTRDRRHDAWLKSEAERLGVADAVIWTGWLDSAKAWSYARAAEIGLSPIPRGELLDVGSPTKAIEYMSLALPVVGNDNPDQALVISESGAGLCVDLSPSAFADAIVELLADPDRCRTMGKQGRNYVAAHRDYERLAAQVMDVYRLRMHEAGERASPSAPR